VHIIIVVLSVPNNREDFLWISHFCP